MKLPIEKRIEALESKGAAPVDLILVVSLRATPCEMTSIKLLGQQFDREPDETGPAFSERLGAFARAHRKPGQTGVQMLFDETDLDQ